MSDNVCWGLCLHCVFRALHTPRTHRLVSARHVSKNNEYERLHAEKAKSGMDDLELAIMTGNKYFTPDIRSNRRIKKEEEGTNERTPVISLDNEPSPALVSMESLQELTDTLSKLDSGDSSKQHTKQSSKSPVSDLVPEFHSLPRVSPVSEVDTPKQRMNTESVFYLYICLFTCLLV